MIFFESGNKLCQNRKNGCPSDGRRSRQFVDPLRFMPDKGFVHILKSLVFIFLIDKEKKQCWCINKAKLVGSDKMTRDKPLTFLKFFINFFNIIFYLLIFDYNTHLQHLYSFVFLLTPFVSEAKVILQIQYYFHA